MPKIIFISIDSSNKPHRYFFLGMSDPNVMFKGPGPILGFGCSGPITYYYEFIINLITRLCHFARKFILKVKNYSHITKTSLLHNEME